MRQHPKSLHRWRSATLCLLLWSCVTLGLHCLSNGARADDAFGPTATWQPVPLAAARAQLDQHFSGKTISAEQKAEIDAIWAAPLNASREAIAGSEILERVARSLAVVEAGPRELVTHCSRPFRSGTQPTFAWLLEDATAPFVRNNLRLYYAAWLSQNELQDEALLLLTGLESGQVVDPAGLYFYEAIVHHRLVDTDPSRQAALKLLEREGDLPRRYQQLATLIKDDLVEIEHDSLDHISRRMEDIRRRLDLGHAGEKVRKVEDGVIESLDKLIEELEKQQQQQQQSAGGGGSPKPGKPADDSRVAPLKGEGKVDRKDIGNKSDWGSLPPKEREAALQQIGKEFPPHFREAIEQYFRKIAGEEETAREKR